MKTAFLAKWGSTSAACILVGAAVAACHGGGGSDNLSGAACVSGVLQVAAGTHGSLYIQDAQRHRSLLA